MGCTMGSTDNYTSRTFRTVQATGARASPTENACKLSIGKDDTSTLNRTDSDGRQNADTGKRDD